MVVLIDNVADSPVCQVCDQYKNNPDALLEILHQVQALQGYLSDGSLVEIANALNLSRADVHGVVSFYHDYKRSPQPESTVKICRAEACQAVGSEELAEHANKKYHAHTDSNSEAGSVGIEAVYCLGNCALGPSILIGDVLHGRVTPARLDEILANSTIKGPA